MIQVRQNIFETNSSSMHSLSIVMQSDFDRWCSGEVLYSEYVFIGFDGDFVTREQALEILKSKHRKLFDPGDEDFWENHYSNLEEFLDEYGFKTIEAYGDGYDWMQEHFTTPSGEKVVAFGYYGCDG